MSIQAMKQALEALEHLGLAKNTRERAITALRAAIEAAEKCEPVAWLHSVRQDSDVITDAVKHLWGRVPVAVGKEAQYTIPLYTHPQPAIPEGWQLVPVELLRWIIDNPDDPAYWLTQVIDTTKGST